jgi:SAM-dependent methyltransferase
MDSGISSMHATSASTPRKVKVFASSDPEYEVAFGTFLACTDQKTKAMAFLDEQLRRLRRKNTFVDVGAGNGKLTSHFLNAFQKCVAIEPNPYLVRELRAQCPVAEVLEQRIDEAAVECQADFILCSHVFYYLPQNSWLGSLEKIASWLGEDGLLAVGLQNPETDCMKMFRHFIGSRFDLGALTQEFARRNSRFSTSVVTVPAMIRTSSAEDACTIAEFMLNLLPMSDPPPLADLESYVQSKFNRGQTFKFSCDQDFLLVQA